MRPERKLQRKKFRNARKMASVLFTFGLFISTLSSNEVQAHGVSLADFLGLDSYLERQNTPAPLSGDLQTWACGRTTSYNFDPESLISLEFHWDKSRAPEAITYFTEAAARRFKQYEERLEKLHSAQQHGNRRH